MYCRNCGNQMEESEKFCPSCGVSQENKYIFSEELVSKGKTTRSEVNAYIEKENKKRIVWTLVTALIAMLIFGMLVGIFTGIGTYMLILKQDKAEEERIEQEFIIEEDS